ncbi:MAG: hypothetical protein LBD65_05345 [Spirochaetaceae bacterium]|nr:hypothetical protein [Spirochaetaceae bacterium]
MYEARKGLEGCASSHGALRRGRSDSGAPESPVSGACAGNAPLLPGKILVKVKLLVRNIAALPTIQFGEAVARRGRKPMRFPVIWKILPVLWMLALGTGCGRNAGGGSEPASPGTAELPDRVDMYYFYEELCQSCDGTAEFDAIAAAELEGVRDRYPYAIHRINVFLRENRERYQEITGSLGLDRDARELPLLIAGGRVFSGNEGIARNLREAFLTAGEDLFVYKRVYNPKEKKTGDRLFADYRLRPDHLSLVYFYRTTCEECGKVTPLIDRLPEKIAVGGTALPPDIIRINTRSGNNSERIAAFFERYQVPDEDRMVPIVFLAGAYLAGYEAIAAGLIPALETPARFNRLTELIGR